MSWPLVRLDDICDFVRGPFGGALKKDSFVENGFAVYEQQHAIYNQFSDIRYFVDSDKFNDLKRFELHAGDIIMSCSGTMGKVAVVPEGIKQGIINQALLKLTPNSRLDLTYFMHWLKSESFQFQLGLSSHGAAIKNVASVKVLKELQVPLPPLNEQKRIAAILDKADAIRQKRKQAIDLADEFLRSVFLDMFGDPVTNPKGWEAKLLRDVVEIVTGNTPSRKEPENYGNEIEWIKSDNINTPSHFLTSAEESLSESGLLKGRAVNSGAVLMTCIAGSLSCIGNIAIADRRVSFNQQINALVPKDSITTEYLYALMLVSKQKIQDSSTNSMKGMVSKGTLGGIEFPIAPESKQKEFAEFFKKYLKMLSQSDSFLNQSINHFNSLSQKAFSGQL